MYGQFARQSAQVLPYELQAAARSAETERAIGTGLSAAGMLAGVGGAAGGLGGAGAAAGGGTSQLSWAQLLSMMGNSAGMFNGQQQQPSSTFTPGGTISSPGMW